MANMLLIGCNNTNTSTTDLQPIYDNMATNFELVKKEEVISEVTSRIEDTSMTMIGDTFLSTTDYITTISYKDYYLKFYDYSTYSNVLEGDDLKAYLYTLKYKNTGKELTIFSLDEQIDLDELMELTDFL